MECVAVNELLFVWVLKAPFRKINIVLQENFDKFLIIVSYGFKPYREHFFFSQDLLFNLCHFLANFNVDVHLLL